MKTCEVLDLKKSGEVVYSKSRSAGSSVWKEFQKRVLGEHGFIGHEFMVLALS